MICCSWNGEEALNVWSLFLLSPCQLWFYEVLLLSPSKEVLFSAGSVLTVLIFKNY